MLIVENVRRRSNVGGGRGSLVGQILNWSLLPCYKSSHLSSRWWWISKLPHPPHHLLLYWYIISRSTMCVYVCEPFLFRTVSQGRLTVFRCSLIACGEHFRSPAKWGGCDFVNTHLASVIEENTSVVSCLCTLCITNILHPDIFIIKEHQCISKTHYIQRLNFPLPQECFNFLLTYMFPALLLLPIRLLSEGYLSTAPWTGVLPIRFMAQLALLFLLSSVPGL